MFRAGQMFFIMFPPCVVKVPGGFTSKDSCPRYVPLYCIIPKEEIQAVMRILVIFYTLHGTIR